ncbi:hypothetical protein [Ornithinibacillus californiensis]|uniref:hypothetical protein n=1 Tax=Ornithinibacillus californiensis TaxID=161536 RepID=UPI00064E0B1B|nr:hypothetical protein [Ornithinibacillus californiensis]
MDREKAYFYFSIFVGGALIVCLFLIMTVSSKLTYMEGRMQELISMQHDMRSIVSDQNSTVQNALTEFYEQQSWLGRMEMDVKPIDSQNIEAIFEWQVKELQSDSEVIFNYTIGENEDYTAIPAEEFQQGLYQVVIPFELDMKPYWSVAVLDGDNMGEVEIDEYNPKEDFRYYVSVQNSDGSIKNGDIEIAYLEEYGPQQYGNIDTNIDLVDGEVHVVLYHHMGKDMDNLVEEAYLLKYENNNLVDEVQFKLQDEDEGYRFYVLNNMEPYEDMRLVARVVYSDGQTFENEIYK